MKDGFPIVSDIPKSLQKGVDFLSTPTATLQQAIVETIVPEITNEQTPPTQQQFEQVEASTEQPYQMTDEEADESAEMFVELINMFQELVLGFLAKRKARSKAEEIAGEHGVAKMKQVIAKIKQTEASKKKGVDIELVESVEDIELKELHECVEAFMDELEFTEREKKRLMTPLKMIMKKRNKKLSPETLLFIATMMSIGSRIGMLTAI